MVGGSVPDGVASLIHRIQVRAVRGVKPTPDSPEKDEMPTRTASAKWEGGLKGGKGSFKGATGLGGQYSFSSRFEEGPGSNPEELLAAAEAACFSMALSANLEKNGTPPTSVDTTARCTIEKVNDANTITRIDLEVRAVVPNLDQDSLQRLANQTAETCPVSRALRGNVQITAKAKLSS
jgi:osmotically inducible protein OsmC